MRTEPDSTITRRPRIALASGRGVPALWATLVAMLFASDTLAQFAGPLVTNTRIRYVGSLLTDDGESPPTEGDQIAVFFEDQIIGRYTFTQGQEDPIAFAFFVSGDDPFTDDIEGPKFGDPVTFQFYDSSTNFTRTDIAPVNSGNEVINVVFRGQLGIDIPIIDLPDELLFPTADPPFDLRLGADPGSAGGGGDGPAPTGNPDVDNNGAINREDAALVIRIVTGSGRGIDDATRSRADVNGDGRVTSADAIEVLRRSRGG
ncbi:MAG: hypothetical protein H6813_05565 [Phycisphaeraceae bacterium]|nr:hypothetical protein [Phycisphaeraceae bacterium]MCB9847935.1 hypothetical protein [Phycisphaeraceae bacterium]